MGPATTTQQTAQSGPGIGGGGLGSAVATGMAFGVGSGLGHAAAGSMINAVSGGGDEENGVMYDEYDDQRAYDQQQQQQEQHPCVKYWEQFQSCMNMNSDDIGGCQRLYDVFGQCQ